MRARHLLGAGAAALAISAFLPAPAASASVPHVEQADLNGDINNIMAAYISASVSRAEADHADALLVVINTPGGISTSMDDIVTSLLNSKVPVIAFVYPSGARAASAGLFVAQAADVLAMTPGTNIGSAHPIQATGADIGGDLGKKVLNDAVTRVRNLASMHGRNADWAEDAVRNSVNINAEQAVQLHVADLESSDPASLLNAIDGRTVQRVGGSLTIHTAGAQIQDFPMPFWMIFLTALIDPTVAALLILLADYGIISSRAGVARLLGMPLLSNTGPIGLGVNPLAAITAVAVTAGFFVFFMR